MKKTLILCTLLCAGGLNGMKRPALSSEFFLPTGITKIVASSDNLDSAIISIITLKTFAEINNLQMFTALTHVLAQKFATSPYKVALKFFHHDIPIARKYTDLYMKLEGSVMKADVKSIKALITQGADITGDPSLLFMAIINDPKENTAQTIKLLLEHGADPFAKGGFLGRETALDMINREESKLGSEYPEIKARYKEIKKVLEEAMKQSEQ